MSEEKVCPMNFSDPCGDRKEECRKDKCAWWDEEKQKCAILVLAQIKAKK